MIIDWTSGAIQHQPTMMGLSVWTWSGIEGEDVLISPTYIFTAEARSLTDVAAARSVDHVASARNLTDTADAGSRMNQ